MWNKILTMKKLIFTTFLGILLGGLIVYSVITTSDRSEEFVEQVKEAKSSEVNQDIKKFINVDYLEYVRLIDAQDRYKKADELLGKAILIFLADVAIRLPPEVQDYMDAPKQIESLEHQIITKDKKNVVEQIYKMDKTPVLKNEILKKPQNLRQDENRISFQYTRLRRQTDAYVVKDDKDLLDLLRKASYIHKTNFDPRTLNGVFKGDLVYTKKVPQRKIVEILKVEFNFSQNNQRGYKGPCSISHYNKSGSRTTYRRELLCQFSLKVIDEKTFELLLELKSGFFYHIKHTKGRQLILNHYQEYRYVGFGELYKQDE